MASASVMDVLNLWTQRFNLMYMLQLMCIHTAMSASMHFEYPVLLFGLASLTGWGITAMAKSRQHAAHGTDCCSSQSGASQAVVMAVAFNALNIYYLMKVSFWLMQVPQLVVTMAFFLPGLYAVLSRFAPLWTGQAVDNGTGKGSQAWYWVANAVLFFAAALTGGLVHLTPQFALFGFVQSVLTSVAIIFFQAAIRQQADANVLQKAVSLPGHPLDAVFSDPVLAHVLCDFFKYSFVCCLMLECMEDDFIELNEFLVGHVLSGYWLHWLMVLSFVASVVWTTMASASMLRRGTPSTTMLIVDLSAMVAACFLLTKYMQIQLLASALISGAVAQLIQLPNIIKLIGYTACSQ